MLFYISFNSTGSLAGSFENKCFFYKSYFWLNIGVFFLVNLNKISSKNRLDSSLRFQFFCHIYIVPAMMHNIHVITKTYLYNFNPLKPHFYIVKLRFTGVYIIFLISAQNIDCGYSLEPPRRDGSNGYPQSMFCAEI